MLRVREGGLALHTAQPYTGGTDVGMDLALFWAALQQAVLGRDRVLRWQGGTADALGLGAELWIAVRDVYGGVFDDMVSEVERQEKPLRMTVSGTPGVGKSLFALYAIWRLLVRTDRPVPGVYYQFGPDTVVALRAGQEPQELPATAVSRVQRDSWFILDVALVHVPHTPGHMVWISSPKGSDGFKQFDKQPHLRYFIPPWTEAEVRAVAPLRGLDVEFALERFSRHGGVARHVFSLSEQDALEVDGRLEGALSSRHAGEALHVEGDARSMKELNHLLVHMLPRVRDNDVMWGVHQTVLASAYVMDELVKRRTWAQLSQLSRVLGTRTAVGGNLFERYFHYYMTSVAWQDLQCRNLRTGVTQVCSFGQLEWCDFVGLPAHIEDAAYYVPTSQTFRGIDSFCGAGMFQVTVSMMHAVTFAGMSAAVYRVCASRGPVPPRLYFVVPASHAGAFVEQVVVGVPSDLPAPEQWVVALPVDI